MSWTSPKTWSVGDLLTSSDMNTYVRDNTSFLSQPPRGRIYASSAQSIPNLTPTQISPTATDFANGITAASGSLTIVTAGTYLVNAIITFGGTVGSDSFFAAYIYKNGTAVRQGSTGVPTGGHGAATVADLVHGLVAGDVLTFWTSQITGGAYSIDSTGTPQDTSLSALWVSF